MHTSCCSQMFLWQPIDIVCIITYAILFRIMLCHALIEQQVRQSFPGDWPIDAYTYIMHYNTCKHSFLGPHEPTEVIVWIKYRQWSFWRWGGQFAEVTWSSSYCKTFNFYGNEEGWAKIATSNLSKRQKQFNYQG